MTTEIVMASEATGIQKPLVGGLTPDMLKQMGIDISISKEDLLSVITTALADQAEERIKVAQVALRGHTEIIQDKRVKYFEAALRRVSRKSKVKALAKAIGTYFEQAYTIRLEPTNTGAAFQLEPTFTDPEIGPTKEEDIAYIAEPLFVPVGFKWSTPVQREALRHKRYQRGDYADTNLPKFKLNDSIKPWSTPEDLRLVKRELEKEVQDAQEDQRTLTHDTKRAHTRVIKDLLMQTTHGATLLEILDKRTLTARVKGVLAADRQQAQADWDEKDFKRKHGTTHFDDGQEDQAACGTAKRKKTKLSKDTTEVNCKNCKFTGKFETAAQEQARAVAKAAAKASLEARKRKSKAPKVGKLSNKQPK